MRFFSLLFMTVFFSFSAQAQYTTKSAAPVAQRQAPMVQAAPAPVQPRFRPRAVVQDDSDVDEDLPSFEAFEKPAATASTTQVRRNPNAPARQNPNAAAGQEAVARPPVLPNGEIWLYVSDFKWRKIRDVVTMCSWKVVLQNRTDQEIENLKVAMTIRDRYSEIVFKNVKSRGAVVDGMTEYNEICPSYQGVKPKIEILSCKIADVKNSDCMKYIVIK